MDKTLHELHLKFIIKKKDTEEIVAVFTSATNAFAVLNNLFNKVDYEVKESY